jgi:hypothetical protein
MLDDEVELQIVFYIRVQTIDLLGLKDIVFETEWYTH